jgi:protein gp37
MAENTKIEWAHHTFNPWRGCSKVSAGCDNCYAATFSKRNPGSLGVWGDHGTRIVASPSQYKQVFKWNQAAQDAGEQHRVFCASLADIFEDWQGPMLRADGTEATTSHITTTYRSTRPATMNDIRLSVFDLIDATPNLDWLLVTKRPENIPKMWPAYYPGGYIPEAGDMNQPGPRRNVWLLTSVENQEQADKRIPELLKCRDLAPVLGLSCEPLLGPVDLLLSGECSAWACPSCGSRNVLDGIATTEGHEWACRDCHQSELGEADWKSLIDWVIVGGESGNDSRPMHPDWARSLRDQCHAADVPFFFKQWGEWSPLTAIVAEGHTTAASQYQSLTFNSHEQTWRTPPRLGETAVYRVGKKAAGRMLDGLEFNEFPTPEEPE